MRSFVNSRGRSFHMYHEDDRPVVLTPGPTRHTPRRSQGAMRSSLLLPLHFVTHGQPPTTAAPKLKQAEHGYSQNGAVLRARSGGFLASHSRSRDLS